MPIRWWTTLIAVAGLGCAAEFPAEALVADARPDASAQLDGAQPPDPEDAGDAARPADARPIDAMPDAEIDAMVVDAAPLDAEVPLDATSLCEPEVCNGLDDDCDGHIDEGFAGLGQQCNVGRGACQVDGLQVCNEAGDGVRCDAVAGEPAAETCDGIDNNCDGITDNLPNADTPCTVGEGACARTGRIGCVGDSAVCLGEAGAPITELCNGLDDDCDGQIDEAGPPCVVGEGLCQEMGILECPPGVEGVQVCSAVPGGPLPEQCNGLDDDCDGQIDNLPQIGLACPIGIGGCQVEGAWACGDAGPVCLGPEPGLPQDEICNGIDDDCDEAVDEDFDLNADCTAGLGACQTPGQLACGPNGGTVCRADLPAPGVETCDGTDEDCDGQIDEDFALGSPCSVDIGVCRRGGEIVCGANGEALCDAEPGLPFDEEWCDGLDNDCDGVADESEPGLVGSVCGWWAMNHCRVWLGWVDNVDAGRPVSDTWGGCPQVDRQITSNHACVSSGVGGVFRTLNLSGDMDDNDWLSVRFECDAGGAGDWIESHCGVSLAYADNLNDGVLFGLDPHTCPARSEASNNPDPRCVSTSGDGRFHPLQTRGNVNDDDQFSLAFHCTDAEDPVRAAAVASSVEVFLALRERTGTPGLCWSSWNDRASWDACPDSLIDNRGSSRCAGSAGGLGFVASVKPERNVNRCDQFGVALLPTLPR